MVGMFRVVFSNWIELNICTRFIPNLVKFIPLAIAQRKRRLLVISAHYSRFTGVSLASSAHLCAQHRAHQHEWANCHEHFHIVDRMVSINQISHTCEGRNVCVCIARLDTGSHTLHDMYMYMQTTSTAATAVDEHLASLCVAGVYARVRITSYFIHAESSLAGTIIYAITRVFLCCVFGLTGGAEMKMIRHVLSPVGLCRFLCWCALASLYIE